MYALISVCVILLLRLNEVNILGKTSSISPARLDPEMVIRNSFINKQIHLLTDSKQHAKATLLSSPVQHCCLVLYNTAV